MKAAKRLQVNIEISNTNGYERYLEIVDLNCVHITMFYLLLYMNNVELIQ